MRTLLLRLTGIGLLLAIPACGGGGGGGNPAPSPTATSVTVTMQGNMLYIGNTITLTATVTMSNGTTQTATGCAWGTDSANIVTVNASTGAIAGTGSGEATVWCDYQGMRGNKRLRILPNYGGIFLGSYTVTGCSESGVFRDADMCDEFPRGTALPLRLDFQQNDDSLSGRCSFGELTSDAMVATVRVDGGVRIESRYYSDGVTLRGTWDLNSVQSGRITGHVDQRWTYSGYSGEGRITGDLFNTNRQLTAAPLLFPPSKGAMGLPELLEAIRR